MVTFLRRSSEVKLKTKDYHHNNSFTFLGQLAERFGAKWIFGGSILFAGILTLLTPFAARLHVGALIAIRILIGAFEVN